MDLTFYLVRHADISDKERMLHRHHAHLFYFEYWLLHRSARRTLAPVPALEAYFPRLLQKDVLPYVDVEDPLQIRKLYSEGKCKDTRLIDIVGGLKNQDFVSQFRAFTGTSKQKK